MKPILETQQYIHVRGFIKPERAANLATKFRALSKKHDLPLDHKVKNALAVHNFLPFVRLLVEKIPQVNTLVGEPVLPTYTYARIYGNGAILKKHIDRAACEISLTLNLGGDHDWPIWFETPSGEAVSLSLSPGDAVLYLGCKAFHWREEFEGNEHIQVFLHYVRSEGPCAFAFFDRAKKRGGKPKIEPPPPDGVAS